MNFRILSWNLYHGRDFPPRPAPAAGEGETEGPGVADGGFAWKVLGRPVEGRGYVRLNRDLFREFAAFIAAAKWDVALLQEVPPRWAQRLAEVTGAEATVALTSRNWIRPFTFPVARFRPQLAGSWEGGSNVVLVRGATRGIDGARPGAAIVDSRRATLTWTPERRVVQTVELECGLQLANFHASTGEKSESDVLKAAGFAVGTAGDQPLVLGGDFNLRPRKSDAFRMLEDEYGLAGVTGESAIDHLLVRDAEVLEPGEAWPAARRDVPDPASGLKIRLSDHAPVSVRVRV